MSPVNWVQLGWAILAGLGVGLIVYMAGTAMDKVRDRRWERELNADVRDITVPEQRDGTDGA